MESEADMSWADKMSLHEIPGRIKDKRVLMRVDFNCPLDGKGGVTDTKRIEAVLPTIEFCLESGAKSIVLMSHLGRPDGNVNYDYSMNQVLMPLQDLLKKKITQVHSIDGFVPLIVD